jgi:homoserine/homoserine lactone efflux protein
VKAGVVLAFAAVAWLSILTPGPAVFLALRNGAGGGVRAAIGSSLGNVSGIFLLSAAATLGLGALLMSSARLFGFAKLLGAGYLFYLGVRYLFRGAPSVADAEAVNGGASTAGRWAGYREGLLLAVTNPKPILFFTALFPQFVNTRSAMFPQFLALTGIFMVLSFVTLMTYASIARRARVLLIKTRVAGWINRTMGLVFIGFAALLLMYRRPATQ